MRVGSTEMTQCIRCDNKVEEGRVCDECVEARRSERLAPSRHEATEHDKDGRLAKAYIAGVAEYGVTNSVARLRRKQARLREQQREVNALDGFNADGTRTRFCHVCQMSLPVTGRCDDCTD